MSDLTKGTVPAPTRVEFLHPQTRQAGVEIAAGDALYIDSNGLLQKAVSTVWSVTGTTGMIVCFAGQENLYSVVKEDVVWKSLFVNLSEFGFDPHKRDDLFTSSYITIIP